MRDFLPVAVGKSVRALARLRGGGSALPGLVVERAFPRFIERALGQLPYGVIVVSGTNGKTTTTKMLVEMLQSAGLTVFTNKTGSNFLRGVIAAALAECTPSGRLRADIAVLELDEAHAMYFIERVPPRFTLLLNVLRDQLDRFGEIDTTAAYLRRIAEATTEGLVCNSADRLVHEIATHIRGRAGGGLPVVREYGLGPQLRHLFPSDEDFHQALLPGISAGPGTADGTAPAAARPQPATSAAPESVLLTGIAEGEGTFLVEGESITTPLQLEGLYNTYNAAAALTMALLVQERGPVQGAAAASTPPPASAPRLALSAREWVAALSRVRPAFGRGERLQLDGQPIDLVLVKNPAGFRLGLASFEGRDASVMIAINDQYADGRDMSWLWDVDFTVLARGGSAEAPDVACVSGVRAWDMALRLEHDAVIHGQVEPDLARALALFREATGGSAPTRPRRIYCTYTAMLELRRLLAEITEVEDVWS